MNILTWFNYGKYEHLRAFQYLWKNGMWPLGFIPNGMEFPPFWRTILVNDMAEIFLKTTLAAMEFGKENKHD